MPRPTGPMRPGTKVVQGDGLTVNWEAWEEVENEGGDLSIVQRYNDTLLKRRHGERWLEQNKRHPKFKKVEEQMVSIRHNLAIIRLRIENIIGRRMKKRERESGF